MKRLVVTIVGGALLLCGIAALVLPGPGMIVCVGGLALLATQYRWARGLLGWARERAREGVERTGSNPLLAAATILCGLGMIALGIAAILIELPLLNTATGSLIIAGGLFLVVSTSWACYRQAIAANR